ncbi:T9SS type A sorting domain-containing protein [Altibacter lentus]|uniref:T9SS type A sorting domain-containing protein n=1 Tax=Altibacter lentus TaxID=1223410 RepID=UPI0005566720|nr:T9SS type A sorting domain-containing protein [Altibacter lentus]
MKHFFSFILLFTCFSGIAQDAQLFDNDWYLHKIVIDKTNYFPPYTSFEGRAYFSPEFIEVVHPSCEEGFQNNIQYTNNDVFEIGDGGVVLPGVCGDPVVWEFMEDHYEIYYLDNNFAKNPFTYAFSSGSSGEIVLTVENADGNRAVYGNEQLSTPSFVLEACTLFPNPAVDQLNIASELDMAGYILEIYNLQGMVVSRPSSESISEKIIDVSMLSQGIYFLIIKDTQGQTEIKKFIKQ